MKAWRQRSPFLPGLVVGIVLVFATSGCVPKGGKGSAVVDKEAAAKKAPRAAKKARDLSIARHDDKGKMVRKFDMSKDGVADVWKVYEKRTVDGVPQEILVRTDRDINFDGKVDIWTYFNEAGAMVKEEMDLDADNRIDTVSFYEDGALVRRELDKEFDEAMDIFRYYEEEKLVRSELDTTGNGRIDEWRYYELVEGEVVLDRIGKDSNGDGKVDKWERLPD